MLILNTYKSGKVLVTDGLGNTRKPRFTFGQNTGAKTSCGLTWRNDFYVYGGYSNTLRQISKVNGCRLERISNLDFDFNYGGCAVDFNDRIYLCFNYESSSDYKKCRVSNTPTNGFGLIQETRYEHRYTRINTSKGMLNKKIMSLFLRLSVRGWIIFWKVL